MKKRATKSAICIVMCLAMLASALFTMAVSADGTHGFYMTCDSKVVDQKSDGFLIDFYSDSDQALCTYWSNANWSMHTSPTIKKLKCVNFKGGGAYAGLQIRGSANDRTGIMSLWRYEYKNLYTNKTEYIYAKAIYGKTTTYDNEGSGTSCVMPFAWKSSQWYRELLYCWEDAETGNTFIGTWFYDYEADQWFLFAYYNTFLVDSYIKGDIGQFLENYVESTRETYRSFRYRNVYFLSHDSGEWVSSPTVSLRSDANPKAIGEAKLGAADDGSYVWASVDGRSSVDTDHLLQINYKLKQADTPTFGTPVIESFKVNEGESNAVLSWSMSKNSTPQLSYEIVVTDAEGNEIAKQYATRPEVNKFTLNDLSTDAYKCDITITDVFGKKAVASYTSENYNSAGNDTTTQPTPETVEPTQTPQSTPTPEVDNGGDNTVLICVLAGVAVCAVAAVAAVIVIKGKKKKESK